jgi:hypothetical protein
VPIYNLRSNTKGRREEDEDEDGPAGVDMGPIAGPSGSTGSLGAPDEPDEPSQPVEQVGDPAAIEGELNEARDEMDGGAEDIIEPNLYGEEPEGDSKKEDLKDAKAAAAADPFGDAAEDFNMSYLTGEQDDLAADEALAREEVANQLGQGLVDMRARMGRAGNASSGAMAALEADAMRAAQMDVARQLIEGREREQQQTYDRGIGVQGMDIAQQEAANRAAMLEVGLDYLKHTTKTDDEPQVGPESGLDGDEADEAQNNNQQSAPPDAERYQDWTGDGAPIGLNTGQDDNFVYIFGLDGKLWKVPLADYYAGGG